MMQNNIQDGFRVTAKRRTWTGWAAKVGATAYLSAVTRTTTPLPSVVLVAPATGTVQCGMVQ
jgi:hypothetical protein